ncbi:hypothetical protein K3495_g7127 [Podosphaera aphanis]|nr:hypothetical protein K3495_g7127 [Podosphaera aphanis]
MDIVIDSPASMTDRSLPTPTPPDPSMPSPTPTAPPPPPSNSIPPSSSVAHRQILQPVPPSKRVAADAPPQSETGETETLNAYLPRELAIIVEERQRREQAWHVRMMICTSAISSIDSLLANFKEGVEKEEGSAFQKYFRQAISLFAASDAALNPPPIPTHSRPAKGGKAGKGNLPDKPAVVTKSQAGSASTSIPTRARQQMPTSGINLPRKPTASESSWATVVRNGHKKARAAAAETYLESNSRP